jgi:hypothetical protein
MTFRTVDIPEAPTHALADQSAPMLQWVKLADLVIDGRYQREITPPGRANIRRIAQNFRWSRFSPLLVAPIEGGRFAIIDGQHRAHAAALVGAEQVPCMAVLMDLREQAQAFGAINGNVTRVHPLQLYRAALASGEPWAVECDRVVRDGGCELLKTVPSWDAVKPRQLVCIGLVRAHVRQGTGNVVTEVLRGITGSESADVRAMYGSQVLKPFCAAVAQSTRFLRADLARFVDRYDLLDLVEEARARSKASPQFGTPGALLEDMIAARLTAFTAEAAA